MASGEIASVNHLVTLDAVVWLAFKESRHQGWVGSRLRLQEAGLFAKVLASRPASASRHSNVVGFGFGFLKCCF